MNEIVEYFAFAAWLTAGLLFLFARSPARRHRPVVFTALAFITTAAVATSFHATPLETERLLPGPNTQEVGWVTSDACRACHPGSYATWHDSYHRSMTQSAAPKNVLAPFDGRELSIGGRTFRVEQRGDDFYWMEGPEEHRVAMLTGSHYQQIYWTRKPNGTLEQFPWVYEITEARWVPSWYTALRPESPDGVAVWNDNCIRCHSVGQQPNYNQPASRHWDTRVAELGIACGACHGPAEEHIRKHRNPLTRYRQRHEDEGDPTIVNPSRLAPDRATQVCAQCHSLGVPKDLGGFLADGQQYQAGDDLWEFFELAEEKQAQRFRWPDGGSRLGGREYGSLLESACFREGDMSCLSCHSMHADDPQDQIADRMETDEACLQCHEEIRDDIAAHTFHTPESEGSRCYHCHMSYTSYALLGAARIHKIDRPTASGVRTNERPSACNLCHLDRTLAWTAEHLTEWYGQPSPTLPSEHHEVAASVLWAVRGDAVQRAIAAWHFGQPWAREASASGWIPEHLADLLTDPYPAVRLIAHRSLRQIMGDEVVPFDYVLPKPHQRETRDAVREWCRKQNHPAPPPETLVSGPGAQQQKRLQALREQRDRTPIFLAE